MSVKITMEFANIDLAILALGKLAGGKPARAAETEPAPTVDATKAPRRGRSDKGKPRKNAGSAETPSLSSVANQGAIPEEASSAGTPAPIAATPAPAEADKAQPSGEVPGVVATEAEAQKALEKLFETAPPVGGLESAQAILKTFGVARVRDLKEEQRGPFVAAVDAVLRAAEKVVN